jgi:hypothetical protein
MVQTAPSQGPALCHSAPQLAMLKSLGAIIIPNRTLNYWAAPRVLEVAVVSMSAVNPGVVANEVHHNCQLAGPLASAPVHRQPSTCDIQVRMALTARPSHLNRFKSTREVRKVSTLNFMKRPCQMAASRDWKMSGPAAMVCIRSVASTITIIITTTTTVTIRPQHVRGRETDA